MFYSVRSHPHFKYHPFCSNLLEVDGTVDTELLPKAIQCIPTNYRGPRVSGTPEQSIPAVLARLAGAAAQAGHPSPVATNPPVYRRIADALKQLGITPESE